MTLFTQATCLEVEAAVVLALAKLPAVTSRPPEGLVKTFVKTDLEVA
jgi:hypothetical protein